MTVFTTGAAVSRAGGGLWARFGVFQPISLACASFSALAAPRFPSILTTKRQRQKSRGICPGPFGRFGLLPRQYLLKIALSSIRTHSRGQSVSLDVWLSAVRNKRPFNSIVLHCTESGVGASPHPGTRHVLHVPVCPPALAIPRPPPSSCENQSRVDGSPGGKGYLWWHSGKLLTDAYCPLAQIVVSAMDISTTHAAVLGKACPSGRTFPPCTHNFASFNFLLAHRRIWELLLASPC